VAKYVNSVSKPGLQTGMHTGRHTDRHVWTPLKVVAQQRRGRASNPRLLYRKTDALPVH